LRWNFFVEFLHVATLEVFISMALANKVAWKTSETSESWSRYFCLCFTIAMGCFLVWIIAFFFSPCPTKPKVRLEKYLD